MHLHLVTLSSALTVRPHLRPEYWPWLWGRSWAQKPQGQPEAKIWPRSQDWGWGTSASTRGENFGLSADSRRLRPMSLLRDQGL